MMMINQLYRYTAHHKLPFEETVAHKKSNISDSFGDDSSLSSRVKCDEGKFHSPGSGVLNKSSGRKLVWREWLGWSYSDRQTIVLCILVGGRRCREGSFFRSTHTVLSWKIIKHGHLCPFMCRPAAIIQNFGMRIWSCHLQVQLEVVAA